MEISCTLRVLDVKHEQELGLSHSQNTVKVIYSAKFSSVLCSITKMSVLRKEKSLLSPLLEREYLQKSHGSVNYSFVIESLC